jgi:hypothetical protein
MMQKLFVAVLVLSVIVLARSENCFYGIDNVDQSFVKFDLQKGSVDSLGASPDNSEFRVSAAYNPAKSVYYILSQNATDTKSGPKNLFTVDPVSGTVLSTVPFGENVNMPANLVWDAAGSKVCALEIPHSFQVPNSFFVLVVRHICLQPFGVLAVSGRHRSVERSCSGPDRW